MKGAWILTGSLMLWTGFGAGLLFSDYLQEVEKRGWAHSPLLELEVREKEKYVPSSTRVDLFSILNFGVLVTIFHAAARQSPFVFFPSLLGYMALTPLLSHAIDKVNTYQQVRKLFTV